MSTQITILGSGTGGNSILIHTEEYGILIDAGLSKKQTFQRLNNCGLSEEIIKAIIITNDHCDHVRSARIIADELNIPTYIASTIFLGLKDSNKLGSNIYCFDPETVFSIGDFELTPFEIPHDSLEPVGFVIRHNKNKIGLATDLGSINNYVKGFLNGCNAIILESDYDKRMLLNSDRPLHLKRKINGRFGHLSNEQAVNAIHDIVTADTKLLIFLHLSSECNKEEIVKSATLDKLNELGIQDLDFHIVPQSKCPYPTQSI